MTTHSKPFPAITELKLEARVRGLGDNGLALKVFFADAVLDRLDRSLADFNPTKPDRRFWFPVCSGTKPIQSFAQAQMVGPFEGRH